MKNKASIQVNIPLTWEVVDEIRKEVCSKLNGVDSFIIEASEMVASELVENAIKYGVSNERTPEIKFFFDFLPKKGLIIIKVINGVYNISKAKASVIKTIKKINSTRDKSLLYVNRLRELMKNPQRQSRLGLFRIAYEGGFVLESILERDTLTIIAKRNIEA